ncbi:MAG: hypothetical protein ACR2I3_07505, partial [Rhodococcus sp. (in: high G+C Gram-positive bacteria)]
MSTEYVHKGDTPVPTGGQEPVFLPLGPRPEEDASIVRPGARRSYPDDVLARLEKDAAEINGRYPHGRSALLPLL